MESEELRRQYAKEQKVFFEGYPKITYSEWLEARITRIEEGIKNLKTYDLEMVGTAFNASNELVVQTATVGYEYTGDYVEVEDLKRLLEDTK